MAGLVAIMSAKSCSAWVEISISGDGVGNPDRWSCSASSNPFSLPRLMSTSVTSGRCSSKHRRASALVDAVIAAIDAPADFPIGGPESGKTLRELLTHEMSQIQMLQGMADSEERIARSQDRERQYQMLGRTGRISDYL